MTTLTKPTHQHESFSEEPLTSYASEQSKPSESVSPLSSLSSERDELSQPAQRNNEGMYMYIIFMYTLMYCVILYITHTCTMMIDYMYVRRGTSSTSRNKTGRFSKITHIWYAALIVCGCLE